MKQNKKPIKITKKKFIKLCERYGFSGVARKFGLSRQLVRYHFYRLGGKLKNKRNRLTII
jgi:ribosomal protein S14